ncbi:MAG: InlB B-repeat-containing protein, partial [Oscillospiraceae bacterium]
MSGTKLIYDFALLEKALEVGKEYALRAKHKTKETSYVNFNDNKLPVTDQPQIRSYEYDADSKIFTLQLECFKAGNYPTSYYLNGSTLRWINMVADAQGHGTLDVSAVPDLKANMSFTIYAGKNANGYGEGCIGSVSVPDTATVPQVERKLSITSPGALKYQGQIGTDWIDWLLPAGVTAPQFSLENTTGAGTWVLTSPGNGATVAAQTGIISDMSSFTLENVTLKPNVRYRLKVTPNAQQDNTYIQEISFLYTGRKLLTGTWWNDPISYLGNTLKQTLRGTLNLTAEELKTIEFQYVGEDQKAVVVPHTALDANHFVLDMSAVPNGITTIKAVLPDTTGGATGGTTGGTAVATQSLFSIPLRVYRTTQAKVLPTIAPIVPDKDLTFKVIYTSEKPTQNVTIRVYSARGETLRFVKDIDIGMTDKTLAAADLGGQGTYLLYFLLADGTVFAAQKVQLGVAKYTVEFRDWNGELLKSETVSSGESATPPTVENRENYAFSGWQGNYKNVIANSVVVAQYSPTVVTVTFHAMGGELAQGMEASQDVRYDIQLTKPTDPTREGYNFAGWYSTIAGGTPWNFAIDKVTSNLVLYAHWQAPSYSIKIESTNTDATIQCQNTATPGELVKI